MHSPRVKLERRHAATLRKDLADEQEAGLEQTYGLGRQAMATGLGVLDMARIHQEALAESRWFDLGTEALLRRP